MVINDFDIIKEAKSIFDKEIEALYKTRDAIDNNFEIILKKILECKGKVIITAPQGKTFNEKMAQDWSKEENLTFICGHYEGFDQRIYDLADETVSIGDYVLTGGELPTMSMIDATVRLLPGILGNSASPVEESFSHGLLEYPQYTRPADFEGQKVPEVLTSGNHQKIAEWRHKEALRATYLYRPDMLADRELTDEEKRMLEEIKSEKEN